MKPLPNNLRVNDDGDLYCADGSCPMEYVKRWMDAHSIKPHTPVNLIKRDHLQKLQEEYYLNIFGRAS